MSVPKRAVAPGLIVNAPLTFPRLVWHPNLPECVMRSCQAITDEEEHAFRGFSTARADRYGARHPGIRAAPGRPADRHWPVRVHGLRRRQPRDLERRRS